jgi:dTDP-4-amino-4,6-dideoxygalactose transaminase
MLYDFQGVRHAYSYFPVLVDEMAFGQSRDALYEFLKGKSIFCRRYFYPLISHFETYNSLPSAAPENLPIATDVASKVLCLPIYPELSTEDLDKVVNSIKEACRG